MSWYSRNEAMKKLGMDTPNRLWAYNRNPKYKTFFKVEENRLYVKSEFVDGLLKRKNAPDLYGKLLEKYGTQAEAARELAKRANIVTGTAYNLINKLCCAPVNLRLCETYDILWEMLDDK